MTAAAAPAAVNDTRQAGSGAPPPGLHPSRASVAGRRCYARVGVGVTDADELETDVMVVGGGLAGLTAAVALSQAGLRVTVLEKTRRLGGRAQSWTDEVTGDSIHIGPHILLSEYPNMLGLLRMLGTEDRVVWQRDRFVRIVDGTLEIDMKHASLPPPLHYAPSLLGDPRLSRRDLLSNMRVSLMAAQLDEADVLALDEINAKALLRSMGVTPHFIHTFWSFAAQAIMNVPLELCSAGALLRFYQRLIGHRHYWPGFPDGGLGDLFAPGAEKWIQDRGGRVLLGKDVQRLLVEGGRATGALLGDGTTIRARHSIVALPPQAARAVLPRELLRKHAVFQNLVHFEPCPYVSTYLWFRERLTDQAFWARAYDPNDLNCDFYDFSNVYRGRSDRGSLIGSNCIYSARAHEMSDEEIVAETIRELSEYLPAAARAELVHSVVNRIPMAIHCPFPGTEKLRPPVRTPVAGLLLAGDWIATALPSSMESACCSGFWAAEEVLGEVGRPARLRAEHKPVEGLIGIANRATRRLGLPRVPRWIRSESRAAS